MATGRPREYDRDTIAVKLAEWSKKEDSINLCEFCADNEVLPQYLGLWAKEKEGLFCAAYELAKAKIGARRERMLNAGSLHVKAYDLNSATYDFFLREEKRQQKEFESELAKKEAEVAALTLAQIAQKSRDGELSQV